MPPDLFIDRSLGGKAVPEFLADAWPSPVRKLDEVYGQDAKVPDEAWMSLCDQEGWVAVCKDDRIRTRDGERQLLSRGTLRVFCLANGQLKRDVMVEHFTANLGAMLAQADEPGPWLFAVYTSKITRMKLYG